jgi:hypothetical protein
VRIVQFDIDRMTILEFEDDSPVGAHGYRRKFLLATVDRV